MVEFVRGARVKPKTQPPINEDIDFPDFIATVALYAVRDYKVDKATFLRYCDIGFDVATRAHSAGAPK